MSHGQKSTPAPAVQSASSPTTCVAGIGAGTVAVLGKSGITVGDQAFARLKKTLAERGTPEAGLRVAVRGGGCSGLSYALSWDEKPQEKDRIFEREGVRVFVDPKSYIYLVGSVVEYEDTLLQAGFRITNPQAKQTCGCGESFAV